MNRILIFAAAAAAGTALAIPSSAAAADGREFGGHVVNCVETVGLDGAHNPGMHQGYDGFTDHECVMA